MPSSQNICKRSQDLTEFMKKKKKIGEGGEMLKEQM